MRLMKRTAILRVEIKEGQMNQTIVAIALVATAMAPLILTAVRVVA